MFSPKQYILKEPSELGCVWGVGGLYAIYTLLSFKGLEEKKQCFKYGPSKLETTRKIKSMGTTY